MTENSEAARRYDDGSGSTVIGDSGTGEAPPDGSTVVQGSDAGAPAAAKQNEEPVAGGDLDDEDDEDGESPA